MAKAKRKQMSPKTVAAIRASEAQKRLKEIREREAEITRAAEEHDRKKDFAKWNAMKIYSELSSDDIAGQMLVLSYVENLILHGSFKAPEVRK
jgi:uncharacterized protein YyaL (SSP411 family)